MHSGWPQKMGLGVGSPGSCGYYQPLPPYTLAEHDATMYLKQLAGAVWVWPRSLAGRAAQNLEGRPADEACVVADWFHFLLGHPPMAAELGLCSPAVWCCHGRSKLAFLWERARLLLTVGKGNPHPWETVAQVCLTPCGCFFAICLVGTVVLEHGAYMSSDYSCPEPALVWTHS